MEGAVRWDTEGENDPSRRQRDKILANATVQPTETGGREQGSEEDEMAGVNTKKEAAVSSLALGCTFPSVGPPAT